MVANAKKRLTEDSKELLHFKLHVANECEFIIALGIVCCYFEMGLRSSRLEFSQSVFVARAQRHNLLVLPVVYFSKCGEKREEIALPDRSQSDNVQSTCGDGVSEGRTLFWGMRQK